MTDATLEMFRDIPDMPDEIAGFECRDSGTLSWIYKLDCHRIEIERIDDDEYHILPSILVSGSCSLNHSFVTDSPIDDTKEMIEYIRENQEQFQPGESWSE